MIFRVNADEDIRSTNENIDAIPEFLPCNDKTLKYVFLMYDYDSPYARQPHEMRKELVLVALNYTKQGSIDSFFSRNRKNIEAATKAFNKLQYNSEFETLISLKIQIDQWNDLLRKEDKTEKEQALTAKVFDKMPEYIRRVKELEEIVGYRDRFEEDDESLQKTTLEKYLESKFDKEISK